MKTRIPFSTVLFALAALATAMPDTSLAVSSGEILWVTNDGADSPTCGARSRPCRSIGQGIENAAAGDTIEVGAGRYGDLDDNGDLSGPGEEHGNLSGGCEVCITKTLTIVSVHGAAETVISGIGHIEAVVGIFSNGVTFGQKDHGFTLVGGGSGLWTHGDDFRGDILTNVRVAGNTAVTNSDFGFLVFSNGSIHLSDNIAIDTGDAGYYVQGEGAVLERNTAINCLVGFLAASGSRVVDNVATRSRGAGFSLSDVGGNRIAYFIEGNTAAGNTGTGFELGVDPVNKLPVSVSSLRHNTIVGNTGPGIVLFAAGALTNFTANNIFGNGTAGSFANCGIGNQSSQLLRATGNFWGSPAGPGADPADNARGACDLNGSATIVTPFAKEFQ